MPAASGPANNAPINHLQQQQPEQQQEEQQQQVDDLGLLPVVKFLQSALGMKSKVSVCVLKDLLCTCCIEIVWSYTW